LSSTSIVARRALATVTTIVAFVPRTSEKEKRPLISVTASRAGMAEVVSATLAPPTTAPLASLTTPRMVLPSSAKVERARQSERAMRRRRVKNDLRLI
jgi:hypothetical protein